MMAAPCFMVLSSRIVHECSSSSPSLGLTALSQAAVRPAHARRAASACGTLPSYTIIVVCSSHNSERAWGPSRRERFIMPPDVIQMVVMRVDLPPCCGVARRDRWCAGMEEVLSLGLLRPAQCQSHWSDQTSLGLMSEPGG